MVLSFSEPCPEPEAIPPTQVGEEKENVLAPPEAEQTTETGECVHAPQHVSFYILNIGVIVFLFFWGVC